MEMRRGIVAAVAVNAIPHVLAEFLLGNEDPTVWSKGEAQGWKFFAEVYLIMVTQDHKRKGTMRFGVVKRRSVLATAAIRS
jgi:hypothetical protein